LIERGEEFRDVTPIVERPLYINLPELPAAKLEREGGYFGWVLRLLQERALRLNEFEPLLERVVGHLDRMPPAQRTRLAELLSYIRAMLYHERGESEQDRLQELMEQSVQDEEARKEVLKMRKTGAQALMEIGEERGEQRGERNAELRTRRQTLVRLLRRRFGDIPSEWAATIEAATDIAQLDEWLDGVVTAKTLDDLGIGGKRSETLKN
jgi:hypothetical protein